MIFSPKNNSIKKEDISFKLLEELIIDLLTRSNSSFPLSLLSIFEINLSEIAKLSLKDKILSYVMEGFSKPRCFKMFLNVISKFFSKDNNIFYKKIINDEEDNSDENIDGLPSCLLSPKNSINDDLPGSFHGDDD